MLRHTRLEHRFVKNVPERVEPGILYISMQYGAVIHRCCCGCGEEVSTPLTPTDWKLIYDGETVSLWPSVGNWTLKCRSHYIIENSRAFGCDDWTSDQVAAAQRRDRAAKAAFYGGSVAASKPVAPLSEKLTTPDLQRSGNPHDAPVDLWGCVKRWWRSLGNGRSETSSG